MPRPSSSSWRDISSAVEFVPSPAAIGLALLLSYSLLLSSTCNGAATSRIGHGSVASSDHEPGSGNGHQEPFIDYNEGNNFDFNQDHVFAVDDNSTEDGPHAATTHGAPEYRTQSPPPPQPPATSADGFGNMSTRRHPTPGYVPSGETLSDDEDFGTTQQRSALENGGTSREGSGVGIGPGTSTAEPFTAPPGPIWTKGSTIDGQTTDLSKTDGSKTDTSVTHAMMNHTSTIDGSTTDGSTMDGSTTEPPNIICPNITGPYKFSESQNVSKFMGLQGVERTTTLLKLKTVGTCHHKQAHSLRRRRRSMNDRPLTQNQFSSSWQYTSSLSKTSCLIGASTDPHVKKCEFESSTQVNTSTTYDDSSCQITSTISFSADQGFQLVGIFNLIGISYSCRPEPSTSGRVDTSALSGDRRLSLLDYSGLSLAVGMQKIPENVAPFNVGLTLAIFFIIVAGIMIACVMGSKRVKCDRMSWTISSSRNIAVPPTNDIALAKAVDDEADISDGIATENGEIQAGQDVIPMMGTEIDKCRGKSANSDHDNDISKKNVEQVNQNVQKDEVENEQKNLTEQEQEFGHKNANGNVNAENQQILKREPDHASDENANDNTDVEDKKEHDELKPKLCNENTTDNTDMEDKQNNHENQEIGNENGKGDVHRENKIDNNQMPKLGHATEGLTKL